MNLNSDLKFGKAKWKCVARVKGEHRVFEFLDSTTSAQKYSIADNSGGWPEDTDDGVLWLVPMGGAEIYASSSKNVLVLYDVLRARTNEKSRCGSALHVLPFLKELGYKFTFEPALEAAFTALLKAGVLPEEFRRALADEAYVQSMRAFVASR